MRERMRKAVLVCTVVGITAGFVATAAVGRAKHDDDEKIVRKAVKRSTLDQKGTKPFHLKAEIAPTKERDKTSNRTGEVEIWWSSPDKWKREVKSPDFHQIAIANKGKEWQKNEGDYFPEWLRQTCVALIEPVPHLEDVLKYVDDADVNKMRGTTHYSWMEMSGDGKVEKGMGGGLAITQSTGLIFYGSGLGWGALYEDYEKFHGRMVGRSVSVGSPEVTARITTLEALGKVPRDFFNAEANNSDPVIETTVIKESDLRKNLITDEPVSWPALQDGPFEGVVTTRVSVDRAGKIRDIEGVVSDNRAIDEAAKAAIEKMQFKPYLQDGVPVQVVSRITMGFKTERPEGAEKFDSAKHYFEMVRQASIPSAPGSQPYILRATFQVTIDGELRDGQYVDTWKDRQDWKREVTLDDTHVVRAQHGETRYESAVGPQAQLKLLRMVVMRSLEPLPMLLDNFYEADWRIKRDKLDGVDTIRVMAGYEAPDGSFDPEMTRGYWFNDKGVLLRTYLTGLETKRSNFETFGQQQIAREIRVLSEGKLGVLITVTEIKPAGELPDSTFVVEGKQFKDTSDTR